ncbi:MAG: SIR2 family protein [Candidatus Eisenbacteria bacterium]|nr:SIR2 family protein [Candidatus Eisenbacteria bacterium]
MTTSSDFTAELASKVAQQLHSQRVGYLLGAGSSYLGGNGYPLAFELWDLIKSKITDTNKRDDIQAKLDSGATGIEHALDLLDDGGATDTPYRHLVTAAIADLFMPKAPPLDLHGDFVRRIAQRADPSVKVFSLNYDPLIERAAAHMHVRVVDGFLGAEDCYFDAAVFEERIGLIRGTYKGRQFDETVKPVHLLKLHGSLGWYECPTNGVRRCSFSASPPPPTKRLMVPPQRRKATDTMVPPYAALWSTFRGCLGHNAVPINRLVCIGYGFADEHVNAVIEAALARTDFTVLIFTKSLSATAWDRWSAKANAIVVTETQCSLKGQIGPGHADLWSFERLSKEV